MNAQREIDLKRRFQYNEPVELTIVKNGDWVKNVVCDSFDEAKSEIGFYENEHEVYF